MFAEILQPPPEFTGWASSASFVMSAILLAMMVVEKLRGKPTPSEVQREVQATHVSRELFDERLGEHERRIGELEERVTREIKDIQEGMDGMERRLMKAGEERVAKIEKLMIETVRDVARTQGRLDR